MTLGNDFKVQITHKDISDIVARSSQLRIEDTGFITRATFEEVGVAYTLLALEQFLIDRRVVPDFSIALSQENKT